MNWDILDLIILLSYPSIINLYFSCLRWLSENFKSNNFTYFLSNFLFWALKILTFNAYSLKKYCGGSAPLHPILAHKFRSVLFPLNHSFIGKFDPPPSNSWICPCKHLITDNLHTTNRGIIILLLTINLKTKYHI